MLLVAIGSEFDADGSGTLDRAEVQRLAENMGLARQLASPVSRLTLDVLIDDIEAYRIAATLLGTADIPTVLELQQAFRKLRLAGLDVEEVCVPLCPLS